MMVQVAIFIDKVSSRGMINIPEGLICRYCNKEAKENDFAMYDSVLPKELSFVHYDCASVGETLKEKVKLKHRKMIQARSPEGKLYQATIGSVLPKGWELVS